ncbi:hypothetical protein [Arthrobacter sp. YD2]|uniref:acyltransferase n=1 Tax=Arthrobacter sp. YD2 TaxID=3058046 RepID=UPI0025B5FD26|nr:hypothetical protein [Arthrobacter sp. YD2]MDN3904696.1 hypothetical protein [Arthrobacter sp. YD2]
MSVGENSVVGAVAVVTRNVPPNTVVAGNPAKPLRTLWACPKCGYGTVISRNPKHATKPA